MSRRRSSWEYPVAFAPLGAPRVRIWRAGLLTWHVEVWTHRIGDGVFGWAGRAWTYRRAQRRAEAMTRLLVTHVPTS